MSIWDFNEIKKSLEVDTNNLITLNEGNTPTQSFKVDDTEVILKREDLNPTESWKDRVTAYKLTKLFSEGVHEGVISTSGNAAISYLAYISDLNLPFRLHVVVGSDINNIKLEMLKEFVRGTDSMIYIENNPKMKAVEISASLKIKNLKSVIDENAIKAYWSLGFELTKFLNPQEANKEIGVFSPASSGTGFVGMAQGLFMRLENEYLMPRMYICQTQKVHTLYDSFKNTTQGSETQSLADGIIDTSGLRAPQITKILNESQGDALLIKDDELLKAEALLKEKNITGLSYNSLLSVAGFLQIKDKFKFKKVICIASGR